MLASVESWALFFHLLGAFFFVGGAIVAGVAFEAARRRGAPREVALLLGLTRVGVLLVAVGAVLVLPFGLWLVHLGDWGYGAGWVDAALALFVVIALLGGSAGSRRSARASWRRAWRRTINRRRQSCADYSMTGLRSFSTTCRACSCWSSSS